MIHIVIVNYRTPALTIDCLRALLIPGELPAEGLVTVTDCASGDESARLIPKAIAANAWGERVRLIELPRNGGFAYGNNAAIANVNQPLVLLLNPDTVPQSGAIAKLIEFMQAHPRAGIVGSRLQDLDGTPQPSAFRFPSVLGELEMTARVGLLTRLLRHWRVAPTPRDEAHRCDWVSGACMLVRREVIEQIGLLDDGYFMYYEEVDFCRRAARAGWERWYEPAARVVHLVGQSSGVTDATRAPRRLPAYWFESRTRYFNKNHGELYRILADIAWAFGHALHAIYRPLRGKPNVDPPRIIRDFMSYAVGRKLAQ